MTERRALLHGTPVENQCTLVGVKLEGKGDFKFLILCPKDTGTDAIKKFTPSLGIPS